MPRPRSLRPLAPIGTRLIPSTPPATALSTTPLPMRAVARLVACCEDPHWVSPVLLATPLGRPAVSHAVRPLLTARSPSWIPQPVTHLSPSLGSLTDASPAPLLTVAP